MLEMVLRTTPAGNPQAVLDAIDHYAWNRGFLMNIGDRKGAIVDNVIEHHHPKVLILNSACKHQMYHHVSSAWLSKLTHALESRSEYILHQSSSANVHAQLH